MAKPTNRDKDPKIDETVLEETPPNINEPQPPDPDDPDNQDPNPDPAEETPEDPVEEVEVIDETPPENPEDEPPIDETVTPPVKEIVEETQEEKDKKYKSQQTETQIQVAKSKALSDKVDEAAGLPEPTLEELKAYVAQDGVDWEELTVFEQKMAKESLISKKRFALVNDAVQSTKKIDEWAGKVDTFIESTDGKPEYLKLSGNEDEFRKFAMKEAHRGVDIETLLLPAFLNLLPEKPKKRANLFDKAGGGIKPEDTSKITDADQVATLRVTNPREYKRQLRSGKISLDV